GPVVSILARPEDRAPRSECVASLLPHPRFNPRPARRPGATGRGCGVTTAAAVSILARPEDRAPRGSTRARACRYRFQSSPGPKTGRTAALTTALLCVPQFQPPPGPKTGRHARAGRRRRRLPPVSILARPEDRAPHSTYSAIAPELRFQSSPGPKTGRHLSP